MNGFSSDNMIHSERITSWMFWCVGALYTAHIIATSITRFFKYPSIITARNGISGRYPKHSASYGMTHKLWHKSYEKKDFRGTHWYQKEITFPKLLLCSHSMHSKHKLRDFYPDIDGKTAVWPSKLWYNSRYDAEKVLWSSQVKADKRILE